MTLIDFMILCEILLIVVVRNGMKEQIAILINPPLLINRLCYLGYRKEGEIQVLPRHMKSQIVRKSQKKSTIIPVDKDLVPTNNFTRIQGKQFSVVGVQVKEGDPIPVQQFHRSYVRGPLHQQTVYQLKPRQLQNNSFQYHTSYANLKSSNQIIHDSSATRLKSPLKASSPVVFVPPEKQYQLNSTPTQMRTNLKGQYVTTADETQRFTSLRSSNLNLKREPEEPKKQYKYNLFSIFDEAVNTKCSSCGSNEIIATKKNSNWE